MSPFLSHISKVALLNPRMEFNLSLQFHFLLKYLPTLTSVICQFANLTINNKCPGKERSPFLFLFSVTKCFHYSSCKMKKLHFGSSTTLWWLFRWWCWIRFESPPLHSVQFLIHEGLWLNFHMINNSAKISSSGWKIEEDPIFVTIFCLCV